MDYIYIFGTILFTVYGQLILKWRIVKYGELPIEFYEKVVFLCKLLIDPFIFSGFSSAFIASFFWMAAMTKFELSFAYPFMSLSFVFIVILSIILFKEPLCIWKLIGLLFILTGVFITSKAL